MAEATETEMEQPSSAAMTTDALGPFPRGDGWGGVYRLCEIAARSFTFLGPLARNYFWPTRIERARDGLLFRGLGVPLFGRVIPTGGVAIRRITGARMAPYTLAGASLRAARAFFYRACIFEALHLTLMVLLVGLSVLRWSQGRPDLAAENMAINLFVNIYPILHHRYTRVRIVRLLERDALRRLGPSTAASDPDGVEASGEREEVETDVRA